jgi:hypothetical protein
VNTLHPFSKCDNPTRSFCAFVGKYQGETKKAQSILTFSELWRDGFGLRFSGAARTYNRNSECGWVLAHHLFAKYTAGCDHSSVHVMHPTEVALQSGAGLQTFSAYWTGFNLAKMRIQVTQVRVVIAERL